MLLFILESKEELYLAKVFIHEVRSVWMPGWLKSNGRGGGADTEGHVRTEA